MYRTRKKGGEAIGRLVAVHVKGSLEDHWAVYIESKQAGLLKLAGPPQIRTDYTKCVELIEQLENSKYARIV
jgi:hypothetical protein